MPPTEAEIKQFLGKEKFAPSILSSKTISRIALRNGQLIQAGFVSELVGEALFRWSIYNKQVPDELNSVIELKEIDVLKNLLSEDHQSAEQKIPPKWKDAWEYIYSRQEAFRFADGIIALVHTQDKEALPIPFNLKNNSKAGVWDSATSSQEVGNWKDYQHEVSNLLGTDFNYVELLAPIGPYKDLIEGRSLMLALAVALARKDDTTLPEAIKILASGSVINGKIEPVEGMREKMLLASRMGSRIVSVLDDPPDHSYRVIKGERLTDFLLRWRQRFGKVLPRVLQAQQSAWDTHTHDFKGREDILDKIQSIIKHPKLQQHVALVGRDGMGKTALLCQLSKLLSKEAKSSETYSGSREICPWIPGALIHLCQAGDDPHSIIESLITQANAMLEKQVEKPSKPVLPPKPDFSKIYNNHNLLLIDALESLGNQFGHAFVILDGIDKKILDNGLIDAFPRVIPLRSRLIISGKSSDPVNEFIKGKKGFIKITQQKLKRSEIPRLTNVADENDVSKCKDSKHLTGKEFNNKVFRITGGWTHSVVQTGANVFADGGSYSLAHINRDTPPKIPIPKIFKLSLCFILSALLALSYYIFLTPPTPPIENFSYRIFCGQDGCKGVKYLRDGKYGEYKKFYGCTKYYSTTHKPNTVRFPLKCEIHRDKRMDFGVRDGEELVICPIDGCRFTYKPISCKIHKRVMDLFDDKILRCPEKECGESINTSDL
jgi:hypothetical protein